MQSRDMDQMTALGDPLRRQIVELLSRKPSSVQQIADQLPVTRSAVSQHLRVLSQAELVSHKVQGTRHVYYIDAEGLRKVRAYLDKLWEGALGEFKAAADKKGSRKAAS